MITLVEVRKNTAGLGWFVTVVDDNERHVVGGMFPGQPIMDAALVASVVAHWTTALVIGRDMMP